MSDSENLRVLEEAYAAFGRGDIPSLLTHLTDDVEFDTASAMQIAPWHGKRRGLARPTSDQLGQVPPSEKVTDLMAAGSGLRRIQPA